MDGPDLRAVIVGKVLLDHARSQRDRSQHCGMPRGVVGKTQHYAGNMAR